MINIKIEELSKYSSKNKEHINSSKNCACYFCLAQFEPKEIKEWIDEGKTALCPNCKIDSVLGDSVVDLDKEFLEKSSKYWFW
jgi:hypothetical protein